MSDRTCRRELGAFLRARRERTSPAEVGLPGSDRRRTPGLRREELAVIAGVSTTWYAYLEQGRDVRPSDQVLAAIANALRLNDDERTHLHMLNSPTPLTPQSGPGPPAHNSVRHPNDPRSARLTDNLREHSPEAAVWWPRYDIARSHSRKKQFRHPPAAS